MKYLWVISFFILICSCTSRTLTNSSYPETDRQLNAKLVALVKSVDELQFDIDQEKVKENWDAKRITKLEDTLLSRNRQLIEFISNDFSKRKAFSFSTSKLEKETSLKVVFSADNKLCSFAWDTGLGGTMTQNVLICQISKPDHSIQSKELYTAGIANGEQKYNCIPTAIGKINKSNVYFLLGDHQFESNTNGQTMFFLSIASGRFEKVKVLKHHESAANYFTLKRDFINSSYTLEVENDLFLEEKNIENISSVTIKIAKVKKNKFEILLHTVKRDKLLWTI